MWPNFQLPSLVHRPIVRAGTLNTKTAAYENVIQMVSYSIVTRDMVWKLGELQSVYNELQFNVGTASSCTNLLKFC